MSRDNFLRSVLSGKVNMTPEGFVADQLSPEAFREVHELFFDKILEIHASDISDIDGYGNLDENGKTKFATYRAYIIDNFREDKEGYWYNWREMFDTTMLDRAFFEHYYSEMEARIPHCEGRRFLINNFLFFNNIITDGKTTVGFPDWSHAGMGDFLADFATLDVNKPYMKIPELLVRYFDKRGIDVPEFKERFLCVGYLTGLNVLRWHASIDDEESVKSIMASMQELKERIDNL